MDTPQVNHKVIDDLRAWFFAKDRSVILPASTFFEAEEIQTPPSPPHNRGRWFWKNGMWTQLNEGGAEVPFSTGWASWTPVVMQGGNVTKTINYAKYNTVANTVTLACELSMTGAGTAANAIVINGIPVAPAKTGNFVVGVGNLSVGGTNYVCSVWAVGANDFRFVGWATSSFMGINTAITLAAGSVISFTATFEKA